MSNQNSHSNKVGSKPAARHVGVALTPGRGGDDGVGSGRPDCPLQRQSHENENTIEGGLITNSPPSKVNSVSQSVLCSGIDTMTLSLDVLWKDETFFNSLSQRKSQASLFSENAPVKIKNNDGVNTYFEIYPHGTRGYEWIVANNLYSYRIGNWLEPGPKPSVIRSVVK